MTERNPTDVFYELLSQQKATADNLRDYLGFKQSRNIESTFGSNPMSAADEHGNPSFSEVFAARNLIRIDRNTSAGDFGLVNEAMLGLESSLTTAEVLDGKRRKERVLIVNGWVKLIQALEPNALADRPDLQKRLRDLV